MLGSKILNLVLLRMSQLRCVLNYHGNLLFLKMLLILRIFPRQTDQLMEEVCLLRSMKPTLEANHTRISNLEDSMTDIANAIGVSRVQISRVLEKITQTAPVHAPQPEILGLIRTQLSASA